MTRIRQHNVLAAQWQPNGAAIGAPDLTASDNQVFGANVFSPAVQRQRLPKDVFHRLQQTLARGEALDTSLADAVALAMKEWALPHRRGHRAGRVLRQGADPGRARRLIVSHRRHPRNV
jgi:glutamine synthetase